MSWLILDDQILRHPKFVRAHRLAGSSAIHLWLGFDAYCKQHRSDGLVPADMIATVDGPDKRWRKRALEALIAVGLLERDGADLRLHDFLDWNESREEIIAKEEARRASRQRHASVGGASIRASGERAPERRMSVVPNVGGASILASDDSKGNGDLDPPGQPPHSPPTPLPRPPPQLVGSPAAPTDPGSPAATAPKKPFPRLGKRLCPRDFAPNADVLKLAAELGYSEILERETRERMIDWSQGKGRAMSDWQATYRNWLRRDAESRGLKPVKHDAQRELYQAQKRAANAQPSSIAPVPREYVQQVGRLFS